MFVILQSCLLLRCSSTADDLLRLREDLVGLGSRSSLILALVLLAGSAAAGLVCNLVLRAGNTAMLAFTFAALRFFLHFLLEAC